MMEKYLFLARSVNSTVQINNSSDSTSLKIALKVLEKIVAEKLIEHLLSNDLIYLHQYGFLPNRSAEQNLLQIVNYISDALNDNMYCVGIFLDLKKAFDVC
jgi:hypothetical protein